MGLKFDKDPLTLKQNNYLFKIVDIYCLGYKWQGIQLIIRNLRIAYLEQLM